MSFRVVICLGSRYALADLAIAFAARIAAAGEPEDGGYRLHDPKLRVRLLATIPGESLAQVVVDPSGRLFLGGAKRCSSLKPATSGQA